MPIGNPSDPSDPWREGTMFSLDQAILTWDPLVLVRTVAAADGAPNCGSKKTGKEGMKEIGRSRVR